MAVKPMPIPSAAPYSSYSTNKKKKQTNSGYATNTVTSSPQPAQDVSIPSATKNYEQPVPQPPKVTSQTVKSSGTAQTAVGAKNAMDTIQSRPYIYDSVPIPQTNMSGYKQPQGYSSTKSTQKQTGGYTTAKAKTTNGSVYGHSAPENNYGPNREAAQSVQLAEYKPKQETKTGYSFGTANPQYTSGTAYSPQNPYTTKDRVTGYSTVNNGYINTEKQKETVQTVKAGRSDFRIRDDGNTIRFESDTAIDLFDFLDYLNGDYGPNNEMAESVNPKKQARYKQPVLDYMDFISVPNAKYIKDGDYWESRASSLVLADMFANKILGAKASEIEEVLTNIPKYVKNISSILEAKESATETRNTLFGKDGYGYSEYGLNLDGGKPNAFLHIYLAANITDILGEKEAREFLTAHETYTRPQYYDNILNSQPDIPENEHNISKKYPTVLHHSSMDLHNNDLGIYIALSAPTDPVEIEKKLTSVLGKDETIETLRDQFPNHTDRQILFIKEAQRMVEYNSNNEIEAAIIWDELI